MQMHFIQRLREKARKSHSPMGLYFMLVLVVLVLFICLPQFQKSSNLCDLLLRVVPLLIVAEGQTFVLISGGIDLSVSAVLSLSTSIASVTMEHNLGFGIVLCLCSGMVVGLINGLGITKLKINPFLMTLLTTTIVNGISLFIRPYPGGTIPAPFVNFMLASIGEFPIGPFVLLVIFVIVGNMVLHKSKLGRHLFATGGNLDAAKLAGIKTNGVLITFYIISGFCAAFAGLYMAARITCGDPSVGASFQMQSITAAVLGGTSLTGGQGGIMGTVIGAVILIMLGNVFNLLNFNIYWQQVIRGLILIFIVGFSQFHALKRKRTALHVSQPA